MEIIINNQEIYFREFPHKAMRDISNFLTVESDAHFSNEATGRKWDGKTRFLVMDKCAIGYLPFILPMIKDLPYKIVDNRINLILPNLVVAKIPKGALADHQLQGVNSLVDNSLETNEGKLYFPRGILKYATNAGKSFIIASTLLTFNVKSVILIHRQELYNDLLALCKDCGIEAKGFNSKNKTIGNVTIAMVKTLYNNRLNPQIVNGMRDVKLLIVDECHNASSDTYQKLFNYLNPYATLFCSGTPFGSGDDIDKLKIIGSSGAVLKEVTNDDLIDIGFSQKPIVSIVSYDAILAEVGGYVSEMNLIKYSWGRLRAIINICEKHADEPILITVNHVDHGHHIYEQLLTNLATTVEFIHGKSNNRKEILDRFDNKEVSILIATSVIKEGVNLANIRVIIYAGAGKSTTNLLQIIGRGLRNDGVNKDFQFYDFADFGKYLSEWYQRRLDIYKLEKFDILYEES